MDLKHELIFRGDVPADEMARARILAHPAVIAAKDALLAAFADAGATHTAASRVVRPQTKTRKPDPITSLAAE